MKKNDTEDKKLNTDELQQKLDEALNNWKRALADYQNLEKRVVLEKQENNRYHTRILLAKLLEILDHLVAAQEHIKDPGLDLVIKKFESVLESEGLKKIVTAGKDFNPEIMECIEIIDGGEENKIAEELSAGFIFSDGSLLRPARVKVFKTKTENGN